MRARFLKPFSKPILIHNKVNNRAPEVHPSLGFFNDIPLQVVITFRQIYLESHDVLNFLSFPEQVDVMVLYRVFTPTYKLNCVSMVLLGAVLCSLCPSSCVFLFCGDLQVLGNYLSILCYFMTTTVDWRSLKAHMLSSKVPRILSDALDKR